MPVAFLDNDMFSNIESDIFGNDTSVSHDAARLIRIIFDLPINWVGNKKRMLKHLLEFMSRNHVDGKSFVDVFAGSGVVSLMAAVSEKKVHANDLLMLSTTWLLHILSGVKNPILPEEFIALQDSIVNPSKTNSIAFLGDLYEGAIVSSKELSVLSSFRNRVIDLFGNKIAIGNRFNNGVMLPAYLDLNTGSVSFDGGNLKPLSASFAMQMMCIHILQQAFMGGRCYKSQLLATHDKRKNDGEKRSSDCEIGNPRKILPLLRTSSCPTNELMSVFGSKINNTVVSNCDANELIRCSNLQCDVAYFDPPYGGYNSDYAWMYRVCEEFISGVRLEENQLLRESSVRFKGNDYERDKDFERIERKGYLENFTSLLSDSKRFPTWMISFNESSFMKIDGILDIVLSFRKDTVIETADGYKYNYRDQHSKHGSEYMILARI